MKKILTVIGTLAVGLLVSATPAFAVTQSWDISGSWKIDFAVDGGPYDSNLYDLTLSQAGGALTGIGRYPSPGPYAYGWNVAGSISGDTFTLTDTYTLGANGTVMHMSGTVAPDGTISGRWDDNYAGGRTGTWITNSGKAVPICTQTGFSVDGINMTAALINPGSLTGTVNATGCNIGAYFTSPGSVINAEIFGANYFGIVNRGSAVDVANSSIHDIGENPLNGAQHGRAIYYASEGTTDVYYGDNSLCTGSTTGTISNNTITRYQKSGIVAFCPGTSVVITDNQISGLGPVPFIAQNGITLYDVLSGVVKDNTVTGNFYTGATGAVSAGILLFDVHPNDITKSHNIVDGNQAGQLVANSNAAWMK